MRHPIALLGLTLLLAGCAEDRIPDPYDHDPPTPPPTYDLTTEEGAAAALRTLLAARDTAMVDVLLRPEATLQLETEEAARFGWPVSSLLATELRRGLRNFLGGEPVFTPGGVQLDGVDSVRVSRWELGIGFRDAPAGSPYPGTREAGYRVTLLAYANRDTLLAPVAGWLMVHVVADTVDGAPVHRIAGLRDLTGEDPRPNVDGPTLSRLLVSYAANRPPDATLTVTPPSGPSGTRFRLDARASHDPEGGPVAFRFRLGDIEASWTAWSAVATLDTTVWATTNLPAAVAVRDRWLFERPAFATVIIAP